MVVRLAIKNELRAFAEVSLPSINTNRVGEANNTAGLTVSKKTSVQFPAPKAKFMASWLVVLPQGFWVLERK